MSVIPIGIAEVRPVEPNRFSHHDASKPVQHDHAAVQRHAPAVDQMDAVEELGFGLAARTKSESAERERSTSLSQRPDFRQLARQVYRISRLKATYSAFDEAFWRNEVTPRADELLKSARSPGGSIEQLADFSGEDPFKRYLFLLEAQQLAKPGEPAAAKLDAAMDQVWLQHESAVVAGFNTLEPLLGFAQDIEEWDQMRSIYMSHVVPGELARTFKALLERFGASRLRAAVDALRRAIAADLDSPIVCADKTRWQEEHLDLMDNRRIASLIASASELCRELRADEPVPEMVMGFVGGALELVAAPNDRKFTALCAVLLPDAGVEEITRRRVRDYLKKYVPLWLWVSPEARDQMLFPAALRMRG